MKNNLKPVGIALTAALLVACSNPLFGADGAPPFIEVGKRYTLSLPVNSQLVEHQFKVLEVGQNGWVKIAMLQGNQVMWLNTNQSLLIAPFPPQSAE